jgi:energy-coupling factor transport system permease protein
VATYIPRHSPLHAVDPVSKFSWILLVALSMVVLPPYAMAVVFVSIIIVAIVFARVPISDFLRAGSWIIAVGLTVIVAQSIFVKGGAILYTIGPVTVTEVGFLSGSSYGFRLMNVALSSLILIWTSRLKDLVNGIIAAGVPYRLAYMIFVALRFVPLVTEELNAVKEAHKIRGTTEKSPLTRFVNEWRSYMFTLVVNSLRKAEALATAMDVRGFGSYPTRTTVEEFHITKPGIGLVASYIVLTVALYFYFT